MYESMKRKWRAASVREAPISILGRCAHRLDLGVWSGQCGERKLFERPESQAETRPGGEAVRVGCSQEEVMEVRKEDDS